ncbi:hypothetical protein BaRGS_00010551, partial [Batillaria attramentaria]
TSLQVWSGIDKQIYREKRNIQLRPETPAEKLENSDQTEFDLRLVLALEGVFVYGNQPLTDRLNVSLPNLNPRTRFWDLLLAVRERQIVTQMRLKMALDGCLMACVANER